MGNCSLARQSPYGRLPRGARVVLFLVEKPSARPCALPLAVARVRVVPPYRPGARSCIGNS
eukprot:scaffold45779_cov59-Phaeocystis_antarctica.AAC.3